MKTPACLIAAAGLLLLAAGAPDDPNKKDLEKLQGTWKVESARYGGKDLALDKLAVGAMTFEGDRYANFKDDKATDQGTFKVDAAKKPATIDLLDKEGKMVKQGVYEFDGETLKLAFLANGDGRPTEVASKADSNVTVLVLKRDKK